MSGQTTSYNHCSEEMLRAIERVENYQGLEPLHFDLRGYAQYIKDHNIPTEELDESIWSMFRTD